MPSISWASVMRIPMIQSIALAMANDTTKE